MSEDPFYSSDPYGFSWGPLKVSRLARIPRGTGECLVIGAETPHHKVEIYTSRTGRSVRVYMDGLELTPARPDSAPTNGES